MKLKSRVLGIIAVGIVAVAAVGCKNESPSDTASSQITLDKGTESLPGDKEDPVLTDDMYLSETTGEPISKKLMNQRPIAVMIDNELTALDHYGTAEADVVYEMVNSTANDRVTRLMAIYKDWESVPQIGSIRSTRVTNILLYPEWNAVLCHDGGPFYVDDYFKQDGTPHISGEFSRVNNGKPTEFTEYVLDSDYAKVFGRNISRDYDEYRPADESHFKFAEYGSKVDLSEDYRSAKNAVDIDLSAAFKHNSSMLKYNEKTQTYDYYEYGDIHVDGEDKEVLTFDNVILQNADLHELDEHGYMQYSVGSVDKAVAATGASHVTNGYYITGGKMIEIEWRKTAWFDHTRYYTKDENGNLKEITINTGKTYIGLIPSDYWNGIKIK